MRTKLQYFPTIAFITMECKHKKFVPNNQNPKLQVRDSYLFLRFSQQPNISYITRIFSTSTTKLRFFIESKP